MKEIFYLYLRGILMGIADLVPGISGGTIAFITGIYERLIQAVSAFNYDNIKSLLQSFWKWSSIKEFAQKVDLGFLVTLLAGIGSAILLGSHIISYLYETYTVFVLAFFIGLILASCKIIFKEIDDHNISHHKWGLLGLGFGVLLFVLQPGLVNDPSYWYLFLAGFIAVAALFLPGVSGSFILLVLGLYGFVIGAIKSFYTNLDILAVFGLGAILGALSISRIIVYFFKHYKSQTLYLLLGIVIGSTSVPLDFIFQQLGIINIISILGLLIFFITGILVALGIEQLKFT